MLIPFLCAVTAGLAAGCQPASPIRPGAASSAAGGDDVPADVPWSQAVNGVQAGLLFRGYTAARPVEARLLLLARNIGAQPVRILRLGAGKRCWGPKLPVEVRLGGKTVPYCGPVLSPPPPPDVEDYIHLAPGEIDRSEVVMNAEYWGLPDLAGAEITFICRSETEKDLAAPYDPVAGQWTAVEGLWVGEARSSAVRLPAAEPPPPPPPPPPLRETPPASRPATRPKTIPTRKPRPKVQLASLPRAVSSGLPRAVSSGLPRAVSSGLAQR